MSVLNFGLSEFFCNERGKVKVLFESMMEETKAVKLLGELSEQSKKDI